MAIMINKGIKDNMDRQIQNIKYKSIIIAVLLLLFPYSIYAKVKNRHILNRIQRYYESNSKFYTDIIDLNSYVKYTIDIEKHNPTIYSIPTAYRLARTQERNFFGETYWQVKILNRHKYEAKKLKSYSTIGNDKTALENIQQYIMPTIYNVTIMDDHLLSPFNKYNRRFYIYHNATIEHGNIKVMFKPKVKNTQLVKGSAIIDYNSGKIISYTFDGEYDMIKFTVNAKMGTEDSIFMIPVECSADIKISYLGNRIRAYVSSINDKAPLPDRPLLLNDTEKNIINRHDSLQNSGNDSVPTKEKKVKYILWDVIGDNVVNKIRTNFGEGDKGYLRLGPIFNPLYFGYSNSKGIVYKLKLNANYNFTDNSDISIYMKLGYSFKQKQLYYNFPLRYTFNKKSNGYIQADFGTGNRISDSSVLEKVKNENDKDSIDFDKMNLDYFKDMSLRLVCNYDFSEKFGAMGGFIYHRRSAVNPNGFIHLGEPTKYKTFAPLVQLQYRPWGYKSVIFTTDYEHGLKGILGGDIRYDRWEFDASYILPLPCMRSLSLKTGMGFYLSKGEEQYFLDYESFKDNNLPGGWRDDWTGEFELLNSNWYNASDYYVRINTTYESPLMLLAWIPKVGQIIEKERIYMSALTVRKLYPYIEFGYGFTNRIFSMGIFTGFSNHHYEGIGVKFGFELFENW